jgi:hypothetical protein
LLSYIFLKRGEREQRGRRKRRGTSPPPLLKQALAILALVIYKSTVISVRTLELALATNTLLDKFILFRPFISPLY